MESWEPAARQIVLFWNSLSQPGSLHIQSNALQEALEKEQYWTQYLDGLKALTTVIGETGYKAVVLEKMYNNAPICPEADDSSISVPTSGLALGGAVRGHSALDLYHL